jgi:hypothetical protein
MANVLLEMPGRNLHMNKKAFSILRIFFDLFGSKFFLERLKLKKKCTVSEGDLGQISVLTLDCGAVEYYIILPLVAVS